MRGDGYRPRMLRQHVCRSDFCGYPMTDDVCIDALRRHEVRPQGCVPERSPESHDIGPVPHPHACRGNAQLPKPVEKHSLGYERENEDPEPGIAHRGDQRRPLLLGAPAGRQSRRDEENEWALDLQRLTDEDELCPGERTQR